MAYTPPSLVGSGITWTTLPALGFQGTLAQVAHANAFPAHMVSRIASTDAIAGTLKAYMSLVDRFLAGDPIALTDVTGRMTDAATVFQSLAQAANDINALIAANPGTVSDVAITTSTGEQIARPMRTWA